MSCQGNPQKIDSTRTGEVASGQEQSGECKRTTGTVKCQTGRVTKEYGTQKLDGSLNTFKFINNKNHLWSYGLSHRAVL